MVLPADYVPHSGRPVEGCVCSACDHHRREATIRETVLAEREACAALAETHLTRSATGHLLTPTPGEIARAIRARPQP